MFPDLITNPEGFVLVGMAAFFSSVAKVPIASTILSGDSFTGITFMRMAAGVDTGPVYNQFRTKLTDEETAGELETRLGYLAGGHITECIRGVYQGRLKPQPQDEAAASCTKKIKKEEAEKLVEKLKGLGAECRLA